MLKNKQQKEKVNRIKHQKKNKKLMIMKHPWKK